MNSIKGLISEFILQDQNKFSMAADIHNNFIGITKEMLEKIYSGLVDNINSTLKTHYKLYQAELMSNYHYARFKINDDYYIQIESSYYFKTYRIMLRSTIEPGYLQDNIRHNELRSKLNVKLPEAIVDNYFIIAVNSKKYESINNGEYDYLYRIYSNTNNACDDMYNKFIENFSQLLIDIWEVCHN